MEGRGGARGCLVAAAAAAAVATAVVFFLGMAGLDLPMHLGPGWYASKRGQSKVCAVCEVLKYVEGRYVKSPGGLPSPFLALILVLCVQQSRCHFMLRHTLCRVCAYRSADVVAVHYMYAPALQNTAHTHAFSEESIAPFLCVCFEMMMTMMVMGQDAATEHFCFTEMRAHGLAYP